MPYSHPTPAALLALAVAALALAVVPASGEVSGPVGYDPDGLRLRLENVQSVDVSRACGSISHPWAYRGAAGNKMVMRSYGQHHADSTYARALAALLVEDARVDTATEVPSTQVDCSPAAAKPMYLLEFAKGKQSTHVVLWFELGVALFFDAEEPLGMVPLAARADSIWAQLASLLQDDPLLRKPRPESPQGGALTRLRGDYVQVDELPDATQKVTPKFPFAAQELGIEGIVYLQVKVGVDGTVQDAFVIKGHRLLRDEALKAVWQWRFDPAKRHGEPVAMWVSVPVHFAISD